tara:strand:- start:1046 stop:1747 length:702 start_codon:yes stop_codon:yes gene_type:complete
MALQEFISKFYSEGGPSFLNRFEVEIASPVVASAVETQQEITESERLRGIVRKTVNIPAAEFVSFKVVSVTMPGKNIRTTTNENVYGPTYEMAQGLTYAESIAMNFYLSTNHFERTYFMNWMDFIVKPDSYNLEYYDNYKKNIQLYQLDKSNQRTAGIQLLDCYPKTIGAVEYAQENGEVGQISVEFVFKEHYHTDGLGRILDRRYAPQADLSINARQKGRDVSPFGGLDFDF